MSDRTERRGPPGAAAPSAAAASGAPAELELADWRRRVAKLYADVRFLIADDPIAAWQLWRVEREALFRDHSQSPLPAGDRASFRARYWGYDPRLAFQVVVQSDETTPREGLPGGPIAAVGGPPGIGSGPSMSISYDDAGSSPVGGASSALGGGSLDLPVSSGGTMSFRRIGWLDIPFPAGNRRLGLFWMAGYAGGLFLPFRDATNGSETYGAGRYLLDAAKSADLGGDASRSTLVLDFNFSFQPSCAFDPRWACPLAPPENRLDIRVEAGERLT